MGQVSFGTVLREARERKGYDVQSACLLYTSDAADE